MPGVDDGPVASARWREPEGLVADGAGGLLVADVDNETIRRIDLASGTVTTIAGQLGVAGSADGVGLAATFNKPNRLALDAAAGRLYIVDSFNNSVRAMTLADGNVTTLATLPQAPQGRRRRRRRAVGLARRQPHRHASRSTAPSPPSPAPPA